MKERLYIDPNAADLFLIAIEFWCFGPICTLSHWKLTICMSGNCCNEFVYSISVVCCEGQSPPSANNSLISGEVPCGNPGRGCLSRKYTYNVCYNIFTSSCCVISKLMVVSCAILTRIIHGRFADTSTFEWLLSVNEIPWRMWVNLNSQQTPHSSAVRAS